MLLATLSTNNRRGQRVVGDSERARSFITLPSEDKRCSPSRMMLKHLYAFCWSYAACARICKDMPARLCRQLGRPGSWPAHVRIHAHVSLHLHMHGCACLCMPSAHTRTPACECKRKDSCMHALERSCTRALIHSCAHALMHSRTHSLVRFCAWIPEHFCMHALTHLHTCFPLHSACSCT